MKSTRLLLSALLGGVTVVVLSCGDHSRPLAPQALLTDLPPITIDTLIEGIKRQASGLLTCSPLAYDSVTQTIGPEGGSFAIGAHALWIPPGALDSAVSITALAPSDTVNRVRLRPAGLSFDRPAYLMMSYANCGLVGSSAALRIAHTTADLEILYYLLSADHRPSQTVTGQLEHFSTYAVAW